MILICFTEDTLICIETEEVDILRTTELASRFGEVERLPQIRLWV